MSSGLSTRLFSMASIGISLRISSLTLQLSLNVCTVSLNNVFLFFLVEYTQICLTDFRSYRHLISLTGFHSSDNCAGTAAWMHHQDFNEKEGEKAGQDQLKNVTYCFEQIFEAVPYKSAIVWPLTSHLTNHPSKINKTCHSLLEKLGRTIK